LSIKSNFDYDALKDKTFLQIHSGKPLFDKEGAFSSLLK